MPIWLIILSIIYAIGFLYCMPIAYRWCIKGYDYGGQNLIYNGSGALGLSLFWFIFLPAYFYARRRTAPAH